LADAGEATELEEGRISGSLQEASKMIDWLARTIGCGEIVVDQNRSELWLRPEVSALDLFPKQKADLDVCHRRRSEKRFKSDSTREYELSKSGGDQNKAMNKGSQLAISGREASK
jgi:hypothetical protein